MNAATAAVLALEGAAVRLSDDLHTAQVGEADAERNMAELSERLVHAQAAAKVPLCSHLRLCS